VKREKGEGRREKGEGRREGEDSKEEEETIFRVKKRLRREGVSSFVRYTNKIVLCS
jgi:hypothetical protein